MNDMKARVEATVMPYIKQIQLELMTLKNNMSSLVDLARLDREVTEMKKKVDRLILDSTSTLNLTELNKNVSILLNATENLNDRITKIETKLKE